MGFMKYKGYTGSVEYSEEDNCLYGKVLDLPNDTEITYEGKTVAELKKDFVGAINDYIATCEANGIQPRKSYTGTLNVRISPETHTRIAAMARDAGITINAFIRQVLDKSVSVSIR